MKAVYLLWADQSMVEKFMASGVDTFLITCHDMPWENPSNYYDSKEKTLSVVNFIRRRENEYGRKDLFIVPLWVRPWTPIPKEQRWKARSDMDFSGTPCPTNKEYAESRILPAISFAKEIDAKGIIWDLEHLEQSRSDVIPFYFSTHPKYRCNCERCSPYTIENLWKIHSNIIWDILNQSGIPIHGQMPYTYGWTMRQYPGDLHHFTEETYMKDVRCWERLKWEWNWKKYKVSPRLIPGIFCEYHHTEERLINYIKKIYNKYDNFWLYCHRYFNNIPNPHLDYPIKEKASDWFFKELKKI